MLFTRLSDLNTDTDYQTWRIHNPRPGHRRAERRRESGQRRGSGRRRGGSRRSTGRVGRHVHRQADQAHVRLPEPGGGQH